MHVLPRAAYAVLALCALTGITTSWIIGWEGSPGVSGFLFGLVVTPFTQLRFFTFMSNLLVAVSALDLVFRRDWARSWHVIRITATVCIVITGIVFNLLLDTGGHAGLPSINNFFVHILTPILTPIVWLVFGPRQTTWRRIGWATIIPIVWLVVTLVRGAIVHWYPYTILDVDTLGAGVSLYIVAILVFFFVFAAAMWLVDRKLPTLQSGDELRRPAI